MSVQVELTSAELRVLVHALEKYSTIKSAEKMLEYHKQLNKDRPGAEIKRALYDSLLALTGGLMRRLKVLSDV